MKEHLLDHIKKNNKVMYNDSSDLLNIRLNKMTTNLEELLKEAHSQTSHYLRTEIRNMIMWAIAKDDETRENVRSFLDGELHSVAEKIVALEKRASIVKTPCEVRRVQTDKGIDSSGVSTDAAKLWVLICHFECV